MDYRTTLRRTAWVSLLLMVLAGCGQKGPLYLPDEKPSSSNAEQ